MNVCVYCSSSDRVDRAYFDVASRLVRYRVKPAANSATTRNPPDIRIQSLRLKYRSDRARGVLLG